MAAEIRIIVGQQGSGSAIADAKKDIADFGDTAKDATDKAGGGFSVLGEVATGALRALGAAAFDAALGGLKALGGAIMGGIDDAREAAKINAQTEAVITSTGNAAGVTAQQVQDYAASLSAAAGKSLFGDDQIQQSENLLLTFTNIKGAALEGATAISVDMAQAMGGAPKDAAIQLGKALNDPIKGISALSRVGVTFTDDQKDTIQAMVEMGDMAGAQAVILAELNKEFGGSAEAAAKADGGMAQFKDRMGEAMESIGTAVLPLLSAFAGFLNDTVAPAVEAIATAFSAWLADPATQATIQTITDTVRNGLAVAIDYVTNTVIPAAIAGWAALQLALAPIVTWFQETIPVAIDFVSQHWEAFKGALIAVGAVLAGAAVAGAILSITATIAALANPITLIIGAVALLGAAWAEDWGGIRTIITDFWTTTGKPIFDQLVLWLGTNIPIAIQSVSDFWTTVLLPALTTAWTFISTYIIPIISDLITIWFAALKIELQLVADFWNTILLPALTAVWSFISTYVIPIVTTLITSTLTTLNTKTQEVANFWNTVLKPALNAVWTFLNTYVIPIITSLINTTLTNLNTKVQNVSDMWNNTLKPALNAIWLFIQNNIIPTFTWLNDNVLIPLKENFNNAAFAVMGNLVPQLGALRNTINTATKPALETLQGIADDVRGAINDIGGAVKDVINWLGDLAAKIASISIPDWLEGHSPPPMANWFRDIGVAANTAAMQLPAFNAGLQVARVTDQGAPAGGGGRTQNYSQNRSLTYAPIYQNTASADPEMDAAFARSLAGGF